MTNENMYNEDKNFLRLDGHVEENLKVKKSIVINRCTHKARSGLINEGKILCQSLKF